jgi:hypothetical protein
LIPVDIATVQEDVLENLKGLSEQVVLIDLNRYDYLQLCDLEKMEAFNIVWS